MGLKQVIVVRNDLKMPKGKLSAQVAHGSVEAVLNSDPKIVQKWAKQGMGKIVVKVESLDELNKILVSAKNQDLKVGLISDAGRTFLEPGTVTVLGIGPEEEAILNKVTGHLKLL